MTCDECIHASVCRVRCSFRGAAKAEWEMFTTPEEESRQFFDPEPEAFIAALEKTTAAHCHHYESESGNYGVNDS